MQGPEKQPGNSQPYAELMTEVIEEATALREEVKRLGEKSEGVKGKDPETGQEILLLDHPADEEISELAQRLKIFVPRLRDTLAQIPLLSATKEMIEELPLVAHLIDILGLLFYPVNLESALSGTWPTAVHNLTTIIGSLENGRVLLGHKKRAAPRPDETTSPADGSPVSWQDIEITFLSDFTAEFRYGQRIQNANYAELGFQDRRTKNPSRAWQMFRSIAERGGIIRDASGERDWTKIEKRIQEIRKGLRKHFDIPGDPIPYVRGTGYQAVFKIRLGPSYEH